MGETPGPPTDAITGEEQKEKQTRFNRFEAGHPAHEVDGDQIVAYWVAKKLGLIPEDVAVACVPRVSEEQLDTPQTLAVEGFPSDRNGTNTLESGNFHNGPRDEPAAYMLLQAIIGESDTGDYRKFLKEKAPQKLGRYNLDKDTRKKLLHLVGWLYEMETTGEYTGQGYSNALNNDDLAQLSRIFHARKMEIIQDEQGDKGTRVLQMADQLLTQLFDTEQRTEQPLKQIYAGTLDRHQQKLKQDEHRVRSHLLVFDETGKEKGMNPQHLRTTQLANGTRVTYANISGLEIPHGGPTLAMQAVERHTHGARTDLLIFVSDELGENGKPNGSKKVMIKVPRGATHTDGINLQDLAGRLNRSEELFGMGHSAIRQASYGGHPEVVLSPQFIGSELDPKWIYLAVQQYGEAPHYTQEAFESQAAICAQNLGTDKYTCGIAQPRHPYEVAQRTITITLDTNTPVTLYEDDLPVYEALWTNDTAYNKSLLAQKTDTFEAPEVLGKRAELARANIDRYIQEENAPRILEALQHIPYTEIQQMDPSVLLRMYRCIAQDLVAISQVWDRQDMRFRIVGENLPEWMIASPEGYQRGRYDYRSTVQSKVDRTIAQKLHLYATDKETGSPEIQAQVADAMLRILQSPTYQESHQDTSFDSHLQAVLRFMTDPAVDEQIRIHMADTLQYKYGSHMQTHWQRIADSDPTAFLAAIDAFPTELDTIFEALGDDVKTSRIEGIEGSIVGAPNPDQIRHHIAEQREKGLHPPIVTLLVEIGRPIQTLLQTKGIHRVTTQEISPRVVEEVNGFGAVISVPRFIELDREEELIAAQVITYLRKLKEIINQADRSGETQIRLVRGGFPDNLAVYIDHAISRPDEDEDRPDIGAEIRRTLIWCNYNQQQAVFTDMPYQKRSKK